MSAGERGDASANNEGQGHGPEQAGDLAARVERVLADEAGIYADVRLTDGVLYINGLVESDDQRDAATDLAERVAGTIRVQNDLDVEEFAVGASTTPDPQTLAADTTYQMLEIDRGAASEREAVEPDFNEPIPAVGGDMTTDAMVAVEEGIPYMPPTDPVIRPASDDQRLEVVGGFGETSMEEFPDQAATTALGDAPPGDEDIRSQVLEALATDAMTIDLDINVAVRNGVVRLRGRVPTLDDAEAAEEVAGRVPDVVEVLEELEVAALE